MPKLHNLRRFSPKNNKQSLIQQLNLKYGVSHFLIDGQTKDPKNH
jgi:hypothetical protein